MISAGTEVYQVDSTPVIARGATYTDVELEQALAGDVSQIIFDDRGTLELESLLASLRTTAFAAEGINSMLADNNQGVSDWRVGEAIAEAFLTAHRDCTFPWPVGRDLRNPSASPAGTDLVGFQKIQDDYRFAFAEIKTSEQEQFPPSVVTGRHGLHHQLESLRDSTPTKSNLVKYLGHHANTATWKSAYLQAAKRYFADVTDVSIFGILVRDTDPNPRDISARSNALADGCPPATSIELRAKYLTKESIPKLATKVRALREAEVANH